jgi:hypothetical protein
MSENNLYEEKRRLVLARLGTLNPETKIMLGGHKSVLVKDLINHVELDDDFGKKVVEAQMQMVKVLAGSA